MPRTLYSYNKKYTNDINLLATPYITDNKDEAEIHAGSAATLEQLETYTILSGHIVEGAFMLQEGCYKWSDEDEEYLKV